MKCKICGSESGSYPLCRTCYAKREAGEIIKCVKCGSWHYAVSPCHCEEGFQASRTSSEAELPFLYEAKPSLVTKTETAYLNCIKSVSYTHLDVYKRQGKTPLLIQSFKAPYTTSFSNIL